MTNAEASALLRFLRSSLFFSDPFLARRAAAAATSSSPTSDFLFFFFSPSSASSLGATNASSRRFRDALSASFWFSSFSAAARRRLASCDKKYSPEAICLSILLSTGAGGNTWSFFPLPIFEGFLRLTFFFLNLGRNRSQLWFASAGSFASSRLIISSLMW